MDFIQSDTGKPLLHFWSQDTAAYAQIATIHGQGPHSTEGDSVCRAWAEICDLYFPKPPSGNVARWSIAREDNCVVVRLLSTCALSYRSPASRTGKPRDYLWIYCMPAAEETPEGWQKALEGTCSTLEKESPNQFVFVMIAIGLKCAYFVWDPEKIVPGRKIYIKQIGSKYASPINSRLKALFDCPWVEAWTGDFLVGQTLDLEITRHAYPADDPDVTRIEEFLIHVHNCAVDGRPWGSYRNLAFLDESSR